MSAYFFQISDAISGRELHKYCSRQQPAPLLLPTHEAIVRFHSDETGSDLGFQLHYSAEERLPGCGGVYTTKEGVIRSPVYALGADAMSCEYEIRLGVGESIGLDFTTFNISLDSCIEFYDVLETPSRQAAASSVLQSKHCGGSGLLPPSFHSLYNRLRIKFYTGSSPSAVVDRFEIHYHTDCSHTYDAPSGTIVSPGYPNLTYTEQLCTFKIITAPNTVITLERQDFQLWDALDDYAEYVEEGERDCTVGSRVTMNDGLNQVILGPFCDHKLPAKEYVSQTNMLVIHLQIQPGNLGRGFRFDYRAVPVADSKCGGVHTKEGQNIRLPVDADGTYRNDLTCYWIIMAPPDKGILLHWLSFDVEVTADCSYDYVEVYDSLIADASSKVKSLSRFCSSNIPSDLLSHSRILTIKFVSDFGDVGNGFELSYRFVERNACGGHIHASSGMLNSPDYPLNYTNGLDCIWQLTAPTGSQMELQVELFELAATRNCSGDWLEVRNGGSNSSSLVGRFCGTNIPRRIPSFTHNLYLHFHTDDVGAARGFRLSWRIFANGCGGRLTGNGGVITSPNYPSTYPHNAHCEWQLRVNPGSTLQLTIEDLELEDLSDCSFDYLHILNSGSNRDPTYRVLCTMPEEKDRVVHLDGNEAVVVFHSDINNAQRGFRLSYSTVCQTILKNTHGVIESLNYGEAFFEGAINCSWQLRPPRGNHIRLEVTHFDHRANRFPTDADGGLYLIDNGTVVPIVGLGMYNASGDVLTIVHNTSSINFRLEYRVDGCLEELRAETGTFSSLKHPLMYPNNMECYWLIHAQPGQVIELTVLDMDIEESLNCTKDALVVSTHFVSHLPALTNFFST